MTTTPDNLESHLRELTTHQGPESALWQKALDQSAATKPTSRTSILNKPLRHPLLLGLAACITLVLAAGMLLPHLGKPRGSMAPTLLGAHGQFVDGRAEGESWKEFRNVPQIDLSQALNASQGGGGGGGGGQSPWRSNNTDGPTLIAGDRAQVRYHDAQDSNRQDRSPATRSVIQKATIEIQTPDVRAAFAKAGFLISAASGEFIENTSLTGDGTTAQANLTLRVTASRLGEVLNQLRDLGKVQSENTTGEDVTSQVVDLEARLRNEQRIEKELLELLDKRPDAPLKEILELRQSLSQVRQTIEQYIAQRDRLSRLVSLASILVVIRAQAQEEPPAASITSYFSSSIAQTWRSSLLALADSIAWLLSILIGGIIWWLLLLISILTILRYRRRLAARCV